ncbi:MAG: NAD(P)H-dependent oxidoreductase [Casimicrobiaceae bacterium]
MHLEIIIVSTREGRSGDHVARWFEAIARAHDAFTVEVVDLAEVDLPLFDEPAHPRLRQYRGDHTKAWSVTVARADAFVFVTPEYNHGAPPSLLNALDYLVHEWAYKPVGFVSYGGVAGGTRALQMAKLVVVALRMMPMLEAVNIPFFATHMNKETGVFEPPPAQADAAKAMLTEMARWAKALAVLRTPQV